MMTVVSWQSSVVSEAEVRGVSAGKDRELITDD
jgi:hypothetical protein